MASCMLGKLYTRRLYFWVSFAFYLKWGLTKLRSSIGWPCPCEPSAPGSPAAWVIDLCRQMRSLLGFCSLISLPGWSNSQCAGLWPASQDTDSSHWANEIMPCPLSCARDESKPLGQWDHALSPLASKLYVKGFLSNNKGPVVGGTVVGMWSLSEAQRF